MVVRIVGVFVEYKVYLRRTRCRCCRMLSTTYKEDRWQPRVTRNKSKTNSVVAVCAGAGKGNLYERDWALVVGFGLWWGLL